MVFLENLEELFRGTGNLWSYLFFTIGPFYRQIAIAAKNKFLYIHPVFAGGIYISTS